MKFRGATELAHLRHGTGACGELVDINTQSAMLDMARTEANLKSVSEALRGKAGLAVDDGECTVDALCR